MIVCTHGMPAPAACVDCMAEGNLEPAPRAELVKVEAWLRARFPGHCAPCNLAIHEGQQIARMSDGSYRHIDCSGDR